MQQKVLFVVPDGTGIKNYLFSKILPQLVEHNIEIILYHALSEEAIHEVEKLHGLKFKQQKIFNYEESKKQKFYRESICFARLLHNAKLADNPTILTNWKTNHSGIKKGFYKMVEIYGRYLSTSYKRILKAEHKYQLLLKGSIAKEVEFLQKNKPTSLFCTHQRSLTALPIIKAANELGIKTIGAIYSWDNLPKARLTVRTDQYVVWSDYMKKELKLYYPEIEEHTIHITGTPQFGLYDTIKSNDTKASFYKKYDLSENKRTICFSGDDALTSPFDPQYLEDLAASIVENNAVNQYQIIFRRCPVDLSDRYDSVIEKYKDLIIPIAPEWSNNNKNWVQLFPYIADIALLKNICSFSDVVVNIGSTMALDFAYFNKPAIYINYNAKASQNWSVEMIYNFQHFRSMPTKNVVHWVTSQKMFFDTIEKSINESSVEQAKKWLQIINLQSSGVENRIIKTLL